MHLTSIPAYDLFVGDAYDGLRASHVDHALFFLMHFFVFFFANACGSRCPLVLPRSFLKFHQSLWKTSSGSWTPVLPFGGWP